MAMLAHINPLLAAHRRDTDLLAGPVISPANPQRLEGRHAKPVNMVATIEVNWRLI